MGETHLLGRVNLLFCLSTSSFEKRKASKLLFMLSLNSSLTYALEH